MPTIRQVYQDALSTLGSDEDMTVRLLLLEVNGFSSMSELLCKMEEKMHGIDEFQRLFARVLSGEPVQYVLLKTSFCGLDLYVDSRVLIPRPETEELVEKIIQEEKKGQYPLPTTLADIGTGSGCIAFALERHFPKAAIYATDSSFEALEVARINQAKLSSSVKFLSGNLLTPLIANQIHVDLLVSNPPYIKNLEDVEPLVLNNEPHSALFAPNGIDHYVSMIALFPIIMNEGGRIYFEINYDQEKELTQILTERLPGCPFKFLKDMQGKTRFLFILFRKESLT